MVCSCDKEEQSTEPQIVAKPVINPIGGVYYEPLTASIQCDTPGAEIRYTTNGFTPTSTSYLYSDPLVVSNSVTIKAKAFKEGWTASQLVSEQFTINQSQVSKPVITPSSGTYNSELYIVITCSTSMAQIRYTTNGSEPNQTSTVYSTPFTINASKTIKAIAYKDGLAPSQIATSDYTIENIAVSTPTFSPPGGNYNIGQQVEISCATQGATIRYTSNGQDPTSSSTVYNGKITLSSSYTNLRAIGLKQGLQNSGVASEVYNIIQNLEPPTISVSGTMYSNSLAYYVPRNKPSIRITHPDNNVQLRYTIDGTEPDQYSTLYQAQFLLPYNTSISNSIEVKAKAFATGSNPSSTALKTVNIIFDVYKHNIQWGDIDRLHVANGLTLGVNSYTGLYIYDTSSPENTSFLAYLSHDFVPESRGVCSSGSYAFLVGGFGLYRVNISSPANPVLAGSMSSIGSSDDVTFCNNHVVIAKSTGLRIVDGLSSSMSLVSSYQVNSGSVNRITSIGNYVFLAKSNGVEVVSISNPNIPEFITEITGYSNVQAIKATNSLLVFGSYPTAIYNITNPQNPVFITSIQSNAPCIAASGDLICLDGVIYDVSNPSGPISVERIDMGSLPNDLVLEGDYLYTTHSALKVVDISSITQSRNNSLRKRK
jgi:hypothetical protein